MAGPRGNNAGQVNRHIIFSAPTFLDHVANRVAAVADADAGGSQGHDDRLRHRRTRAHGHESGNGPTVLCDGHSVPALDLVEQTRQ